jgi:hypothetical protein
MSINQAAMQRPRQDDQAEKAWELWKALVDMQERIWNRYEDAFLEFCISENASEGSNLGS